VFIQTCERTAPKNDIRDWLIILADEAGEQISKARADKLANKFKKGMFDPELERVIQYSDTTGERAVNNVLREQVAV